METLFYVDSVQKVIDKSQIILNGKIINGQIKPNMLLIIPLNSSNAISVQIDSVEMINCFLKEARVYIQCEDAFEVDFIVGLNLENEEFEIDDYGLY